MSHEVVPIGSGASDGWSVVKTSMRAMEVVVAEPERKICVAMVGTGVVAGPDPFPEQGLDEAFCLAVGARSVRAGEALPETAHAAVLTKAVGAVAGAVVGEDAAEADA